MKKKIAVSIFLLLTCLTLTITLQNSQAEESNVTLFNIEALTNTENELYVCFGIGSLDCPNSMVKVLYIK